MSELIKIEPEYYYVLTKEGYKKDENYITGIKVYFQSPDGIVFYTGIIDTEQCWFEKKQHFLNEKSPTVTETVTVTGIWYTKNVT